MYEQSLSKMLEQDDVKAAVAAVAASASGKEGAKCEAKQGCEAKGGESKSGESKSSEAEAEFLAGMVACVREALVLCAKHTEFTRDRRDREEGDGKEGGSGSKGSGMMMSSIILPQATAAATATESGKAQAAAGAAASLVSGEAASKQS